MRIVGEVHDWEGHAPEAVQGMIEHIARLRDQDLDVVEDERERCVQNILGPMSIFRSPVRTSYWEDASGGPVTRKCIMKYMLIMRTSAAAVEASKELDFEEIINAMGRYNESMMNAGVLLAGEGLTDAEEGFVVDFDAERPIVTDGPYGETHELFNGFWIIQAASREEAAEWASRAPLGPGSKIEVRRVSDESDFEEFADNEYIQKEAGWREQLGTV